MSVRILRTSRQTLAILALVAAVALGGCGPQATPAPAAPASEPTAAPTGETAITAAVTEALRAQGSPLAEQGAVAIEGVAGDFARARVTPPDPATADPAIAFLRKQGGQWTVLSMGTAFGPDFYAEFAIPEALWLTAEQPAGAFTPLPAEACESLRALAAETLGAEATLSEVPFTDIVGGGSGSGCQVTVTGTGADFGTFLEVAQRLSAALSEAGWTEEPAYLADGPTGTATGFRQGNQLVLLSVGWQPGPAVSCPANEPIAACNVPPDQQQFTITLQGAQSE